MFIVPPTASHDPFAHLYREHHGWLHGWLWRKLGCRSGAADLAQDTFIRVLTAGAVQGLREPRAYLTRVARHLLANHWRHLDLERAYLAALATMPEAITASPEEQALMMETLVAIDQAMHALSIKARQVFLLAQFEGLPYADIGTRLAISERMVKKYMAQAMLACASALPGDAA